MGAQEIEPNVQGFLTLVTMVSGRWYGCVGDLQNDLCDDVSWNLVPTSRGFGGWGQWDSLTDSNFYCG